MFFSAVNPTYVFPAYKYALGKQEISSYDSNRIGVSFVVDNFSAETFSGKNVRHTSFGPLVKFSHTYLTNVSDGSVNKDTEALPESSYQAMCNTPFYSYLFNIEDPRSNHYTSACPIVYDHDYDSHLSENTWRYNYLKAEFGFKNEYDKAQYREMNIPEDTIIESKAFKRPDDYIFKDQGDKILSAGAKGIILSYCPEGLASEDKMIPMVYYEFHKPLYSNIDFVKIGWNANGFVEVE